MLINHGPTGGGHSHADSLDFQLHAFGRAMAIDSGIGRTYDDPHHAPWYIRSRSHNLLMVDDADLNRREAEGCARFREGVGFDLRGNSAIVFPWDGARRDDWGIIFAHGE